MLGKKNLIYGIKLIVLKFASAEDANLRCLRKCAMVLKSPRIYFHWKQRKQTFAPGSL